MKKEYQVKVVQAVFENMVRQKKREDADGLTHTIDAERYTSKSRFRIESEELFQNHPIVVGAAGQLKRSGDYFLHDLTGISIIIIKGSDGKVRAFLNMCRHRGVRLLETKEGQIKKNIVCPYHAWSYDNMGCLKGVFHPQGFEGVNASTHSLIELDCWVYLGMVFVLPNPEKRGHFRIDEYLSEVDTIVEGFNLGDCYPYNFKDDEMPCNWKLIVDGALEGYHFKIAHSDTIGQYFLDNLSINTNNKFHSSVIFPKRAMTKFKDLDPDQWNFRKAANVLIHLFPNAIMLIEPDHCMVVTFCPKDEKNTLVKSFMLLPSEPKTTKEKEYWHLNAKIFWDAIEEDNEMAILQQKSFNGYSNTDMVVGSYEKLLVQFENLVDEKIKDFLE